jgi:uncharacterized repeat protein (TIGR03806 family)
VQRTSNFFALIPPLLAVAFVLHACGGGGSGPTDPGQPVDPGPFGLTQRVPLGSSLTFPATAPRPGSLTATPAFPGLSFTRPVFLTAAPDGTDRVFVVEQAGRIYVFPNRANVATSERRTFLDLRPAVGGPVTGNENEEGLLGLAFDPEYATNGTFYVHYSALNPRRSVFARYRVSTTDPDDADEGSAQIILTLLDQFGNHNAGWMGFGPDGYLYIAMGDEGGANDPNDNGQDLADLHGKVWRLNVRGQTTYTIPVDNPFVNVQGARGEIWCLGMRNPWRCSFDRNTGDLWCGDVGQGAREEVSKLRAGGNFGWPVYEGNLSNRNPAGLPASQFDAPVIDYGRTGGSTVVGGYVYRGPTLASVRGAYLYGDYGTGNVWALVPSGTTALSNTLVSSVSGLSSFGEDRDAELYAVSLNGGIFRFTESGGGGGAFPQTLGATGLFTDTAALVPNPGLIEYDVNSPLWSDGASKRRWMALPDGARIGFSPTGAWDFPPGTVFVKHFELELTVGDPANRTRLETRVLIRDASGWAGFTYRWNAAQTDADLLAGGEDAVVTVTDPAAPGGQRDQTWHFPSRTDCLRCHTVAAGGVLGVRTGQLHRDFPYPAMTDDQLRAWNGIGLFSTNIGPASAHEAWTRPDDPNASPTLRARSYMAANCAQCHLPNGPAPGGLDLRWGVPAGAMNVVGVRPTNGDLGLADPWRVLAGDRAASVLWLRMTRLDATRMPPLAHELVDPLGESLVGGWIDSGAP